MSPVYTRCHVHQIWRDPGCEKHFLRVPAPELELCIYVTGPRDIEMKALTSSESERDPWHVRARCRLVRWPDIWRGGTLACRPTGLKPAWPKSRSAVHMAPNLTGEVERRLRLKWGGSSACLGALRVHVDAANTELWTKAAFSGLLSVTL